MCAHGQSTVPPRWDDLPKFAKAWPPAWAALVREIMTADDAFEKTLLDKLDGVLRTETASSENSQRAETILVAALRHQLSLRRNEPATPARLPLQERLETVRADWLVHLRAQGELPEAVRRGDGWLPTISTDGPLRGAIRGLWTEQAKASLEKMDYAAARSWLDRLEGEFDTEAFDAISKPLRERAGTLLKEAQAAPDAQAIRMLEEALALWPRLPEARDALERRKGTFRSLVIAVPALPEQLSPATASTVTESQSLDLLFDRLYHVEHQAPLGKRYRPQLAIALPTGGLTASIPLRRDLYWSNGSRATAADLRHTALLHQTGLWREFLEVPRLESSRFHLTVGYRQGLLDPLAPLDFHVLPHLVGGKQLDRADDPAFAKTPVGSGAFQFVGRKVEASKIYAVFQANPYDLRGGARSLREIRLVAWSDPAKDLGKPLPPMILDAPTDQLPALKKLGYTELPLGENPYVHFLALNQRKPGLASPLVRRAIALAIDRQELLNKCFRAGPDKHHTTANGPSPRPSWATCPAPRVPEELFQAEQARSLARQAKKEAGMIEWTLKFPAGDARVKKACEEIADALRALFQGADIPAAIKARGLPPAELRKAMQARDFDLLYTSAANLDDPVRLALFFDGKADANLVGNDQDVKLQVLLQGAVKHRQFSVAQANLQAVHAHLYETMPVVPLWQLDVHVLTQPGLRMPPLDSSNVFARVREWRLAQ